MDIISVHVVRPKDRTNPVLAYVDMDIDTGVHLRDMRLMRSRDEDESLILHMPCAQSKDGTFYPLYHPVNQEIREQMAAIAIQAYQKAVEEGDVSEWKIEFDVEQPAAPVFSSVRVNRFRGIPENQKLRGYASCCLDDSIVLRRLTIMLDNKTGSLRVAMPSHNISRTRGFASYYRMRKEEYALLYDAVMPVYAEAGNEAWDGGCHAA